MFFNIYLHESRYGILIIFDMIALYIPIFVLEYQGNCHKNLQKKYDLEMFLKMSLTGSKIHS